jgi:biopolymer transport protein ExbD
MTFLPEEELKEREGINLAPMIDFLFLMLAFFASLAVSRVATKDLDINLVKIQEETHATISNQSEDMKKIHISITADGSYKWQTDLNDYLMQTPNEIVDELEVQYQNGFLPPERSQTTLYLKIDKHAPWEPIAKLIFEVRQSGFDIKPVYQVDEAKADQEGNYLVENRREVNTFSNF